MATETATATGPLLLNRARDGRMLAGVCEGIARYAGIDVTIVRLVFVVATLCGLAGALVYVAAWVMIPEEG
jgi:phage shock protein C